MPINVFLNIMKESLSLPLVKMSLQKVLLHCTFACKCICFGFPSKNVTDDWADKRDGGDRKREERDKKKRSRSRSRTYSVRKPVPVLGTGTGYLRHEMSCYLRHVKHIFIIC